jgi:hypothetical protein
MLTHDLEASCLFVAIDRLSANNRHVGERGVGGLSLRENTPPDDPN